MKKFIRDYINSKYAIMNKFGCNDDYPLKPLTGKKWAVNGDEGIFFLSIWDDDGEKLDYAVAKKNGEPLIYKNRDYSMIIAIDCVKIAFLFRNDNIMR